MAARGLFEDGVHIAKRKDFKHPTKDDMTAFDNHFDNLLEDSIRVIHPSTTKRDAVDLFASSPFKTPTKQKTESPKQKKSYKKEQMLSPFLPPSAEKQLDDFTPHKAQRYENFIQSKKQTFSPAAKNIASEKKTKPNT
jgi:hypothetical protein